MNPVPPSATTNSFANLPKLAQIAARLQIVISAKAGAPDAR